MSHSVNLAIVHAYGKTYTVGFTPNVEKQFTVLEGDEPLAQYKYLSGALTRIASLVAQMEN